MVHGICEDYIMSILIRKNVVTFSLGEIVTFTGPDGKSLLMGEVIRFNYTTNKYEIRIWNGDIYEADAKEDRITKHYDRYQ